MIDAILYKSLLGYPASIGERPARYQEATVDPVVAPWVRISEADLRARIASTDAAWSAYQDSLPVEKAPIEPVYARSPDGTRWQIQVSDTGAVSARRT